MKRYWKVIILPIFIIITFGVLYVHHVIAKNGLPEFELVTVEGDKKIGEQLMIYGDYHTNNDSMWHSFRLTADGIVYKRDLNFFEQYNNFFESNVIQKLIEEDSGFMRGKTEESNLFVDTDKQLAYVGPDFIHNQMEVDVQNKESGDRTSFRLDIPERSKYHQIYVEEVQMIEDTLYAVTINYFGENKDVMIYEISIDEEKIIDHYPLMELPFLDSVNVLSNDTDIGQKEQIVVSVDHIEVTSDGHHLAESEYFTYHFETKESKPITFPDDFTDKPEDPFGAEDYLSQGHIVNGKDNLYFINFTPDGLTYYVYDLVQHKFEEEESITLGTSVLEGLYGIYPEGDSLYLYSQVNENGIQFRKVFMVDLVNAENLYEGEIRMVDGDETNVYGLEIFRIQER